MDPLGFGLENFYAIGRFRTKVANEVVDASGEMTTGEKFNGAAYEKESKREEEARKKAAETKKP